MGKIFSSTMTLNSRTVKWIKLTDDISRGRIDRRDLSIGQDTDLVLLISNSSGVEHVLLLAFPQSTSLGEPKAVAICGGNLAAVRCRSQTMECVFPTAASGPLVSFLIDLLPETRSQPQ